MKMSTPELLGLFGLTWQEKVANAMSSALKGSASGKVMSDFFQAGGKNVRLVDNLYREYAAHQATGWKPSTIVNGGLDSNSLLLAKSIKDKTNVDVSIVVEFLRAVNTLARDGKIPFEKWNPAGYKVSEAAKKSFSTERGFFDFSKSALGYGKIVLIIAGIGVSAYLIHQVKGFKDATN